MAAAAGLAKAKSLAKGVDDASEALQNLADNAGSPEEERFFHSAGGMIAALTAFSPSLTKEMTAARQIAKQGLLTTLQIAAGGIAPGGVGRALAQVGRAIIQEADDKAEALPNGGCLARAISVLESEAVAGDGSAIECLQFAGQSQVPVRLSMGLAEEYFRSALDGKAARAPVQVLGSIALEQLQMQNHTSCAALADDAGTYVWWAGHSGAPESPDVTGLPPRQRAETLLGYLQSLAAQPE